MNQFLFLLGTMIAAIAARAEVVYQWPVVQGLPVNQACATATTFKSTRPVPVCLETKVVSRLACRKSGEADSCRPLGLTERASDSEEVQETLGCIKSEARHLEVSRVTTARRCLDKPECLRFETVTQVMSPHFRVEKYKQENGEIIDFIGTEDYRIPDCGQ